MIMMMMIMRACGTNPTQSPAAINIKRLATRTHSRQRKAVCRLKGRALD
jgi:hypothetical protein